MANPDDELFRAAFSDPMTASQLVAKALPPDFLTAFTWSEAEAAPPHLLQGLSMGRHSNVMFAVRTLHDGVRGERVFVLVHRRRDARRTAVAEVFCVAMHVQVKLWEETGRTARTVTPILPVVLYHGREPWAAPTRLLEFVGGDAWPAEARAVVPNFQITVCDLSRLSEEDLLRGKLRPDPPDGA